MTLIRRLKITNLRYGFIRRFIISSVISMASALGLTIIAEGVETKEQADMLLGFGCELMQGYYFSKPIPAEEYEKMLEQDMNKKRTG